MERDIKANDTYIKKLNALLPAEITGLYLFIRSLAQDDRALYPFLVGTALVIAILFYLVAPRVIHVSHPVARILYCVTFLLWAASIDVFILSDILGLKTLTFVIPAFIAVWTFALPYLFDGFRGGGAK